MRAPIIRRRSTGSKLESFQNCGKNEKRSRKNPGSCPEFCRGLTKPLVFDSPRLRQWRGIMKEKSGAGQQGFLPLPRRGFYVIFFRGSFPPFYRAFREGLRRSGFQVSPARRTYIRNGRSLWYDRGRYRRGGRDIISIISHFPSVVKRLLRIYQTFFNKRPKDRAPDVPGGSGQKNRARAVSPNVREGSRKPLSVCSVRFRVRRRVLRTPRPIPRMSRRTVLRTVLRTVPRMSHRTVPRTSRRSALPEG